MWSDAAAVVGWLVAYWEPVAVLSGAALGLLAALFAGWQLRATRRQELRTATMDHIRHVMTANNAVRSIDISAAQDEVLDCSRNSRELNSEQAQMYQELLDSLDVMGFAARKRMISLSIAAEYLDTILDGDTVSPGFLRDLSEACGHAGANKDLLWLLSRTMKKPSTWRRLYDAHIRRQVPQEASTATAEASRATKAGTVAAERSRGEQA